MTTANKRHPLTTRFVAPADTHTVLVVTSHYWGRGTDKASAMRQCKREGGDPGKNGYLALYFGAGFKRDTGWVDPMGYIRWEFDGDPQPRPEPAREEVGLA